MTQRKSDHLEKAGWVWPASVDGAINQYVEFQHVFSIDDVDPEAKLQIAADSNYVVEINGRLAGTGQYHDSPGARSFDTIPAASLLTRGENAISGIVYHQGVDSFQYIPGKAGLIYSLENGGDIIKSGTETEYRVSERYKGGSMARITRQLGFVFHYDSSRPSGDWERFADDEVGSASGLRPRPIERLHIKDRTPTRIVTQGAFKMGVGETVAERMRSDFLSTVESAHLFDNFTSHNLPSVEGLSIPASRFEPDGGTYLLIDLGREEAGVLEMDLEAEAGTVVDIAWGEHLEDLRVRSSVGDRNFAGRYICKSGRQTFTHYFTRLAGRYLQLHISRSRKKFTIHYAGLRPTEYPVSLIGEFQSPDRLQDRIYLASARTLHLCMHEHYEDCPWREQALYAMDSRNQALAGYYAFGEYDFPRESFNLLGEGLNEDGYLELCAPARIERTIPCFSLAWMLALADHYLYSGRKCLAERWYPTVRRMLDGYQNMMVDGLMACSQGKRYWHFYEWADGLNGWDPNQGDFENVKNARLDAPLNLFLCLALESAGKLAEAIGEDPSELNSRAQALKKQIHDRFWDEQEGCYATYIDHGKLRHHAELTQSLAILADCPPDDASKKLIARLTSKNNGLVETTLSHSFYKFEAIMKGSNEEIAWIFEKIAHDWGYMITSGATSFWETIKGAADFGDAGSLCHGWSGIPIYFYHTGILGVRPLEPGFKRFSFAPTPNVVPSASGVTPTPYGPISVRWRDCGGEIEREIDHPKEIECVIG